MCVYDDNYCTETLNQIVHQTYYFSMLSTSNEI